jgi:hypothetical protein
MVWCAGATADVNCSLCKAGTYGTGSGLLIIEGRWTGIISSLVDLLTTGQPEGNSGTQSHPIW